MPGPSYTAHSIYLWFQAQIWLHMMACRALNQYDNCVTSDQNCHKLLFFQLLRVARQALFESDGRFLVSHCCDLALLFGGIAIAIVDGPSSDGGDANRF